MTQTINPLDHSGLIMSIINRHFSTNCRISKQDLLQEGYVAILNARHKYDQERGKPSTFVYHCINNHLKDVSMRNMHYLTTKRGAYDHIQTYYVPDSYVHVFNEWCDINLEEGIQSLRPRYQQICRLMLEGKDQKKIAKILDCSKQNISRQCLLIIQELKKYFKQV